MPITNEVSLNEVISSACLALGMEENDRYKVIFYDWAYQALTEIGLSTVNIKTSTGSISTGNTCVIPNDCIHIDSIAIRKGASGDVAYPIFDSNYWSDVLDEDQMHYDQDYVVSRQGNNLIFSDTVSNNGFTVVFVSLLCYTHCRRHFSNYTGILHEANHVLYRIYARKSPKTQRQKCCSVK